MYESIQGVLKDKTPSFAFVDLNGLTYRLHIPLNTYTHLPVLGTQIRLFLSHVVKEDSHTLFAFHQKEPRDLFETLITISGIGPKTALAIIGHLEIASLQRAIQNADISLLSKVPGIGKKTAERLVIELRDKMKLFSSAKMPLENSLHRDAVSALMHLGYKEALAQKAIEKVTQTNNTQDLGILVTEALRSF